jgi:hypothetical protein
MDSSLWLLGIVITMTCGQSIQAQVKESTTTESRDFSYATSRRAIVTRTEQDGRTIETSTIQEPSSTSGYTTLSGWATLIETEQQATKVNPNTTTVVKRRYARDVNGNRRLLGVTVEQQNTTADGRETVVRTASNTDVNDRLQVVEREVRETVPSSDDTRQTTISVTRYGADDYPFEQRSRRIEQRRGNVTEQQTTVSEPDGNGNFVPIFRTESTTTKTAWGQKKDERVYRDTGLGKMTVVRRDVSSESKDAQGTHSVTQTYSALSSEPAGSPVLIQQVSTSQQRAPDGSSQSKQQIESIDFGKPASGLQLANSITETVQPTSDGETKHQIVRSADGNGGFPIVRSTNTRVTINRSVH